MKITGKTKQLAVIGDPINHSFSPEMHNFISEYTGNDYTYSAFRVKPHDLSAAIGGMRAMGICGMNITAPHKIEVMQYMDELSDDAKLLGSVNTVVNRNGVLTGYNTDSDGFAMSLKNADIDVCGRDILVMGCGGVAVPVLAALIRLNPKSITLLNRTESKAQSVAEKMFKSTGYTICTSRSHDSYDVVINTTSAGMGEQKNILPWENIPQIKDGGFITSASSAVDIIYNPDRTEFLKYSEKKGAKILNGLDMLIYQGVLAYELFTGLHLPENIAHMIRKEVFAK